MRKVILVLAVLMLGIGTRPAMAQETKGAVQGVVKDSSGGVLPGVTVQAASNGGGSQTTVTDAKGVYRFPALTPGTYSISSTLSGFTAGKADSVKVVLGQLLTVDLTMAPGGRTETVDVHAEVPIIDVKQNSATQVISADVIDLLPKTGTGILGSLSGLPGAGNEGRLGGFAIDGAGASENRYIIDGMDASNLQSGALGKDLNIDFIDQLQVKSSGYNAEYRAATGGVVSAITKSGTNRFHGDISDFLTGRPLRGLQGAVRPQLRIVPTDPTQSTFEYFYTPRLNEQTTNQPTYNINGPIVSSRLWFFAGYNPVVTSTVRNVIWTTPTAFVGAACAAANSAAVKVRETITAACPSQSFATSSKDTTGLYNVVSQLASSFRVRFNGNNERTTGALSLPNIDSNFGTSSSNATTFNPRSPIYTAGFSNSYSATADWTLSNTTFVSLMGGFLGYGSHSAFDQSVCPAGTTNPACDYYHGVVRTFSGSNINFLDVPADLQHASGFSDNLSNSFSAQNDFTRLNFNGDVTRFFNWKGQHSVKAGAQLERFGNDVNNGQQFPNATIVWNGTRATLSNTQVRGTYGYYFVFRQYTVGNVHSNNIGMFVQDQWSVSKRLTVNYGVRTDNTKIPSYRAENAGITFGFMDKIAPRLGFAYDVKGDGKWKTYGSFGSFYDIEKLEMPLGSFGAQHWISYYWTLDSPNWPAINCDGTPSSGCPGKFIEQVDFRHVSNGQGADNLVDPGLKPYKSSELTFGANHEFGHGMSGGIRFTHKWINMAIEDVGVQVPGVGEVFYTANPGYGLGEFPLGTSFPATPKPVRHYDGLEFTFDRRLSGNWMLRSSLVLSRTFGSYSGLTSSDEAGRNSPNVNRFYDGLYMSFDQTGKAVYGRLESDRPYQIKIQPAYMLPWGTMAGAEIDVESGQPQNTMVLFNGVPVFPNGRNDLGYSPTFSYVNLNFQQAFKIGKRYRVNASLNIENLFDQMAANPLSGITNGSNTDPYRDTMTFTQCGADPNCADKAYFAGFNTAAVMAADHAASANTGRVNPLFNHASSYQGQRSARFQIKFSF